MNFFELLVIALVLDAIFGEPDWLWKRFRHPVSVMGSAINWLDQRFNNNTRAGGIAVMVALVMTVIILGVGIRQIPDFGLIEAVLAAILLAQKSLTSHVAAVANALTRSLTEGKEAVKQIVGRDTTNMDETAVSRAAIESVAENFSDGVIAPAFWFLIFGLPGILVYKIVNTADSMIGYKSEKYLQFGWAAARLDDVLNYVPARLSAGLICAATQSIDAWKVMRRDAHQHRSPNAGWPESAMAGAMGIALAGPRAYGGEMGDDLFVNHNGRRDLTAKDIHQANKIIWQSWAVFDLIIVVLALIF